MKNRRRVMRDWTFQIYINIYICLVILNCVVRRIAVRGFDAASKVLVLWCSNRFARNWHKCFWCTYTLAHWLLLLWESSLVNVHLHQVHLPCGYTHEVGTNDCPKKCKCAHHLPEDWLAAVLSCIVIKRWELSRARLSNGNWNYVFKIILKS